MKALTAHPLLQASALLPAALLLSACTSSPLQQQILPATDAAQAATLVLSSKNEGARSTITVAAINDRSVLQKSNLLLKPGHYKLTLKILQGPDQSLSDGNIQPTGKTSTTTLEAELKASMRYVPRSSIKGLMVKVSLEEGPAPTGK
ncbi:MAG: hypothetical protein ACRERR_07095 [Moraxellaceae bacterium]